METGKFNTVIGNLPPGAKLGDGNTIVNAADENGNVILNTPMAVGYGAMAGKNSIAIGAFSGGGIASPEIDSVPHAACNPTTNPPNAIKPPDHSLIVKVGIGLFVGVLVIFSGYLLKTHFGISQ